MMNGVDRANDARQLLHRTRVEVAPEIFFLVGLSQQEWSRLIERPELSPRQESQFMMLRDEREVTLLVTEEDWRTMRHGARGARVEGDFRLVTLDIELGWNVTGYIAHVTSILAQAEIPCGVISAFSRDHLLIKQDDLAKALLTLGPHVAELC